ncbi:MAG: tyrosine-type recombinase/integrase [Alphaproteobacteria bacterium]|nr:tyrosine-type recombinase/integrase [Alphaproteobacteria bacterium]
MTTAKGVPYKSRHFKQDWAKASKKAGIEGAVFHGLRKTAAKCLAEAGCTAEQIKSITGHKTDAMVSHYTAEANKKKLAIQAMEKLESAQPNLGKAHNFVKKSKR